MIADLSSVVQSLASGTYSLTRTVFTRVNGRSMPTGTTTITITGSVQPISGEDTQRLPEGLRNREVLWLFTDSEVFAPESPGPDLIQVDGKDFEVVSSERWAPLGNYWRAMLAVRS